MASTTSTLPPFQPNKGLDLDAIRSLISALSHYINGFLADQVARKSLQLECSKVLAQSNQMHFEFSEQSVLSNLYWGIENIEAAIQLDCEEERSSRLAGSENMLQIPALLEEDGSTAGVENRYIVCFSYFYLALVQKLQGDEWQMTMHLLQSFLVSPSCFRTHLACGLWESLFGSSMVGKVDEEEETDEKAKQIARRYKDWLMYYQVIFYGEAPRNKPSSVAHGCNREAENHQDTAHASIRRLNSMEQPASWPNFLDVNMVNPVDVKESIKQDKNEASTLSSNEHEHSAEPSDRNSILINLDRGFQGEIKENFDIRCLHDMLQESQSDSPVSFYPNVCSSEASDSEVRMQHKRYMGNILPIDACHLATKIGQRICLSQRVPSAFLETLVSESPGNYLDLEASAANENYILSKRSQSLLNNLNVSILNMKEEDFQPYNNYITNGTSPGRSPLHDSICFSNFSSKLRKKYSFSELISQGNNTRRRNNSLNSEEEWSGGSSHCGKDIDNELLGRFEMAVSDLYFSDGLGNCKDADALVITISELIKKKKDMKCSSTNQEILEQLLDIIATSKTERVIRASVYTLLLLISRDKTVIQEIKKKDLHLYDLASALKRNVHEAATLIYLLNPSPSEIRSLELLPALVEVACSPNSQNEESVLLPLTPTSASIAMIEVLVTAFDYVTNNIHLATISSPQILSKLVNVAMNKNLEEGMALAAILIRCMRLNGNCKKFLSQVTPLDPFLQLLRSNEKHAKFAALEYFNEILRMPRSSAIHLLDQIKQQGIISIMHSLMACIQQTELEYRLLAANLLLQLDVLEASHGKSVFREEAIEALLESISTEENPCTQTLSANILANLGGTHSWTGEPYTLPWLLKRAGLSSTHHRNMIKDIDWLDPCLQDSDINSWSSKAAKGIIKTGRSAFDFLVKGVQSKNRGVSRNSLICIAWLGSEMANMGPRNLRYSACEVLLSEIAHFLHPGSDFDERILSCLCIYNYTSGKGKQKLVSFSEGLRESLRRLSGITWMAEELLKVTDYFLPTKPRVSCVHTLILEVGSSGNGAATSLIFYKGQLCVGYSDGSIKVWEIKGQRAILQCEVMGHKRAVTCFALSVTGESVLSGSSDKTVRVWKMVKRRLECVEVLDMKEPIQKIDTHGDKILVITERRMLKVRNATSNIQTICKNKHVKALYVSNDKIYLGCTDSSIQEVDMMEDTKTEIKAPSRTWRMPKKPINSIRLYKGWLYSAGVAVEGSNIKDWRKRQNPQISIAMPKGTTVEAMEVVEDFIYMKCSSSENTVQIWLRGKQQKVGRISTGSKITSLLTANDIIFCGTESGSIKGWIPL